MNRRNWNRYQPTNLQAAIEACIDHARDKHNLSVDSIADQMGLVSKWAIYKWVESASIPARQIRAFEHTCGCTFVTRYLAASAHQLLVPMPTGRISGPSDVIALQAACTDAVQALIQFNSGKRSADETLAAFTTAMTALATERSHVERHHQPELDL